MTIIDGNKENFDKVIEHIRHDISTLRTGRATPALVEDIIIDAYGTKQPLKAVASITAQDAKTLVVDAWDKSVMKAVEDGIRKSDVGINPVNDGTVIRLPLPELNAERRADLIKLLHKKLEEGKIAIRKVREDIRNEIEKAEKDKTISEDEKFSLQDALDGHVKSYNEEIKAMGAVKEADINTI
ncbi:MAG: ribosome recycling factor [Candidatus Magasanikbacteria bacterium]|jgi:ribosome recycling factor|nr:ribosome recycling factor [Candidatus Magasanikbacteria bacterium]